MAISHGGACFGVLPFEVIGILENLVAGADKLYISILRYCSIEPQVAQITQWDDWIVGRIKGSKIGIQTQLAVAKRRFFDRSWQALIEAGLIIENADGCLFLPKFKKRWLLVDREAISEIITDIKKIEISLEQRGIDLPELEEGDV